MSSHNDPKKGWTPARVREHMQNAVYLEMWTVPLYLTAAYSLDVPIDGTTNRPEFAATPTKQDGSPDFDKFTQTDYNQYAFNNVLSVAIQEMLHVELAANILNAVRPDLSPVTFTGSPPYPPRSAPDYSAPPACLADDQLPDGVDLRLGPFDSNQARLFRWIEAEQPLPPPPYDLEAWHATYNSIGHFYTSLMFGLKACWEDLYPRGGRAHDPFQRDDWEEAAKHTRGGKMLKAVFSGGQPSSSGSSSDSASNSANTALEVYYKQFSIKIFGAPDEAYKRAEAAMTAIKVQGEGAGGTQDVPTKFRPTGDPSDDIEIALDKVSHWERFDKLVALAEAGKFSYVQLVSPAAPQPFQNALNQSYSAFLSSLNEAFSGNTGAMSIAAMAGLGNRVLQAWQNGVEAGQMFQWVDGNSFIDPSGAKGFHACQGLDKAGTSNCASGFYHTCAGANLCRGQGGCGAKITDNEPTPINWQPGTNECKNLGHCGIPIPSTQCFDDNTAQPASVWEYARKKLGFPTDEPQPNALRSSLSSTSGVKCPTDE